MPQPDTIDGVINYANAQRQTWEANMAVLGVSQSDIDDLASQVTESQQKRAIATQAKETSKSATSEQNAAVQTLRKMLSGLTATITATAKNSSDPVAIYNAADLPVPKTPSELKTPPPPIAVTGQINSNGEVELAWRNPSKNAYIGATYFLVQRVMRNGNTLGELTLIGTPADRKFKDTTVPEGFDGAIYRISATRNNKTSASASVTVNFGIGLGGGSGENSSSEASAGDSVAEAA